MPRPGVLLAVVALCPPALARSSERIPWNRDEPAVFVQAGEHLRPVMILFVGTRCGATRALPGALAPGTSTGGTPTTTRVDFQDDCELMEQDVLSRPDVVDASARFVPFLTDDAVMSGSRQEPQERALDRYAVTTVPTVVFADPWGNEIIRVVGYAPWDKFLKVMKAIPSDFAPLVKAGPLTRKDGKNASALVVAAAFYDENGLLQVSDRLFERALGTRQLKDDVSSRRQVAIARGTTLLKLNRTGDAGALFRDTLAEDEDGPLGDALLFGWMMAELQGGRLKEARAVLGNLQKRFPDSPYTAKGKEHLATANAAGR